MNLKFKLSPLWLFLLLLIVLIISSIFIKPYAALSKESFIGFYGSTASNTAGLTIPNYPNPVHKLYDNDFFDPLNGNLLRVYAAAYDAKAGQDTTGATIDHVDVIDRSGKTTKFQKGQPITTGSLMTMPNGYLSWTAYSTDSGFSNITSNQILYCAWGQDTYIHVFDLNHNLNSCGFLYSGTGGAPIYTNFNTILPALGQSSSGSTGSANTGTYVFDSDARQVVYQLTPQVVYVPGTGDLRVTDSSNKSMIYNRAGQLITSYSASGVITSSTTPWTEVDLVGGNLIVYIPNQTKTTIVVLKKSNDGVSFSIVSAVRFNANGSVQMDENTAIAVPTDLKAGSVSVSGGPAGSTDGLYSNIVSSFNRNFTADEQAHLMDNVMQSLKGSLSGGLVSSTPSAENVGYTNQQISDYILKTQIVPPICPAQNVVCPGCASGSCTSCGSPAAAAPAPAPVAVALAPSPAAVEVAAAPARASSPVPGTPSGIYRGLKEAGSETGSLLRSVAKGTVDLAKEGTSGAVNVGRDVAKGTIGVGRELASGTVGLGREILGGTVGLGREVIGETVGLGKEVLGGTVGAVKGVGKNVAGLFKEDQTQIGTQGTVTGSGGAGAIGGSTAGYYAQGVQGPQNPWTYNGTLSEKPSSEFIPITADFSAFKK